MIAAGGRHQHQDRAVGQESEQKEASSSCRGLLWGAGADQEAHQQPEIVSGDMEEIALVNVVAPA